MSSTDDDTTSCAQAESPEILEDVSFRGSTNKLLPLSEMEQTLSAQEEVDGKVTHTLQK